MSGKLRQRASANAASSATQTINERILKECHTLYTEPENGLVKIAESLGLPLLAPRKKINVLLIGNHSAGKSSFINWYVEEHVQRTGVAIETQGFTFVTSGRKRESLTGNATLHLYPHFEPLRQIHGVTDYLTTELSTSKQKKFSLVTFVDTPGLVDGDMKYPFDVNEAILWLGDLADLIFIFFDPIGQALCKRTLNLVEKLNEKHADRIRFYLSKADEAGLESDRQRVMMQIVQELCKRPGLNRTGFNMLTIYIPFLGQKANRCVNQIEDVCQDIEKTINQTIQNTLNTLEKDCDQIADIAEESVQRDGEVKTKNTKARIRGLILCMAGFLIPLHISLIICTSMSWFHDFANKRIQNFFTVYLDPLRIIWGAVHPNYQTYILVGLIVFSCCFFLLAKIVSRTKPALSRTQKRNLMEIRDYVQNTVKSKKQKLYQEYLKQSVTDQDL